MLTLNDGRTELWQWDTGRTLAVDADCSQVHFSNKVFGRSIDVDVVDGAAIIPDILLQTDNDLNVWAFVGTAENGYTKISKTFKVNRRNKPSDYVFTPTDKITIQTIQLQIGDLADLTTEAKENLVDAINEAAASGGGSSDAVLYTPQTLTYAQKKQARENIDAASIDFVINGTLNDDDELTLDKTYAQIQEAVQAGKRVTIKVNKYTIDISIPLIGENDTGYIFEASLTVFPTVSLLFFASVSESGNSFYTEQLIVADSNGNMVQISMDRDPEQPMEIATKKYVDDHAGGGTDMGITGAAVGQIAKITAVDASGVPTAWEPVDLPGGGGDEWVKVAETTLTEIANEIRLNFDPCKAVYIEFQYGAVEGNLGVIGIYPNPQTPIYTAEKRTCAVDTTTSDKNKRGYIFCTIDRRKGTQWVATSQIFQRGDGAFGSIQPGNLMNCDIWVDNDNTWASLLLKEKLVGTDYINSVSAFGAGMNIGTTLTVWGIKA